MIGQRLGARGLAVLAVAGLFAGGAATVGASGGVGGAADNASEVLSTLHIPHKTHGHGNGHAGDRTPDDASAPSAEGTQRAIKGIPTDNPQHHPADSDGTCDKGETVVKTTPSGVQVNVPCQTAEDHGKGTKTPKAGKTPKADKTPEANEANETPEADETPDAEETPGANGHEDRGPVTLPTQANPHASEGAGNGVDH